MRPINNIVDATNYAMLEIGQPLHAFDYDVLKQRAGGIADQDHHRERQRHGERLTTLDGVERKLSAAQRAGLRRSRSALHCRRDGRRGIRGHRQAQQTSCSKARAGTSSTSAARPKSTTCRPRPPSASRAACIRPWRRLECNAACSSWRSGRAVRSHPAWSTNMWLRPKDPTVTFTTGDVKRLLGIDLPAAEDCPPVDCTGLQVRSAQCQKQDGRHR